MITTGRAYQRARREWAGLTAMKTHIERMIINFEIPTPMSTLEALTAQIRQLETQLEQFDALHSFEQADWLTSIDKLPEQLVKTRLRLGWSQMELSRRVGINRQQIHRFERDSYANTNLSIVIKIANVLSRGLAELKQQ